MTDVAAAFPSTSKSRVLQMLSLNKVHPTIIRWVADWLTDRSIETWIDGQVVSSQPVDCGVPQGSPCSPVLFAPSLAVALKELPPGVSYVDDCSWVIDFSTQVEFEREARSLLDSVHFKLQEHGFAMDEAKTEVAWVFAGERPRAASKDMPKEWRLKWHSVDRRFDIKAKPVR